MFAQERNPDFPILKGPYLGQKPPGLTPEIFAPGIVSTEMHEHSVPSFSPDGNQILWSSQFRDDGGFPTKVIGSNNKNGIWTEPDFFGAIPFENSSSAFFAPDGKRIYFTSTSEGSDKEKSFGRYDIWYIENSKNGWTSPKNLGLPVNSPNLETYATLTNDMTLYFMGEIDPEKYLYGIYRSEFTDGKYQTPELLPENINTEYLDWTPFIAPDESYLLFSSDRPNSYGNGDLYISYKNPDNTWTDPVNLGPTINDDSQERFPYVSPDGKYLFYVSNKFGKELTSDSSHSLKDYMEIMNKHGNGFNDIYWVDAKIIVDLKPEELKH
jgi:Tol biopolymer transport system component